MSMSALIVGKTAVATNLVVSTLLGTTNVPVLMVFTWEITKEHATVSFK